MFEVYLLEEKEIWERKIKEFKDYDIYYMPGYVNAFRIHGDGIPLLLYYEDEDIRAINVVMKRDIAKIEAFSSRIEKDKMFDLATPYGYGGWIVESKKENNECPTEDLFLKYSEWCIENHIVSEFVRYSPILDNAHWSKDYYTVVPLGKTIMIDVTSPETIWENFTSKNRNMIRKAIKNGIKIYNGSSEELYDNFKLIYEETMDRDEAADYYYFKKEFYDSLREDLSKNAWIFYAMSDADEIIAASIILEINGHLTYHLSGSKTAYRSLAPTNLLLYEASLWGNEKGCVTFHLGGGVGSGEDSLYEFKKAFNRKEDGLRQYYIGKKIFDKEVYRKLMSMRADLKSKNSYFPEYRFPTDKLI